MTPQPRARGQAWLAALLAFWSLFVFPALPLGKTFALAVPYAFAGVLAVVWALRLRPSEWQPFAWLLIPMVLSGAYALVTSTALAPDVVPKAIVAFALASVIVIPTRHLVREGQGESFLLGAAIGILVHAAAGAWQLVAFERGEFPFAGLMATYPGMAMSPETMETYALYVRRPFGLFAEPSAMAACVGPWLVAISAALSTRRVGEGRRSPRVILALALVCGLALVVVSKSGIAIAIAIGAVVPIFAAALSPGRSLFGRVATLVGSLVIAGGSTAWLLTLAGSRFDLARNDSWQLRLSSLEVGVRSLLTGPNVILGVGPGQTGAHITTTSLGNYAAGNVDTVWSALLAYVVETGVVGLAALLLIGLSIALSIATSRARVAGGTCAAVWLLGIVLATSYLQLPAVWAAMALLLSWRPFAQDVLTDDQAEGERRGAPHRSLDRLALAFPKNGS
jgi:hypothetical protein